ncbi:MAG: phage virion morphogenesis protein [Pseudomonadota bacterium]|nr:phage virion morphogenesis protein [Pseudomonadota bacterium]
MAGSFITVRAYGSGEINALLTRIARAGTDLEPAFEEIGDYLIRATEERFKLELAPNGEQWEPLAPETLARKAGEDRILQQSGILRDQLNYQITGKTLTFGSNQEYAATHQFGREEDGIPARPFLGLTTGPWRDEDEIVEILQGHLLDAIT